MPVRRRLVEELVGPASTALVPIADLRAEANVTSAEDAKLLAALAVVARLLQGPQGLRRPPWRAQVRERLAAPGGDLLPLSRYPIEEVLAAEYGEDDPEELDLTEITLASLPGTAIGPTMLRRRQGWPGVAPCGSGPQATSGDPLLLSVTTWAGWLMPGEVVTWSAAASISAGGWARATTSTTVLLFQAGAAGVTGGAEPTWPDEGETVADGTVTWTARRARRLPEDLEALCRIKAASVYRDGLAPIPVGIASESDEGGSVVYARSPSGRPIGDVWSPQEAAILAAYR